VLLAALPAPAAWGDSIIALDPNAKPGQPGTAPNSAAAEQAFIKATAGGSTTLIDFEGLKAYQPADGSWFAVTKDGTVLAKTTGTDHPAVVPQGYQFGITNLPNSMSVENNPRYGFSVSGTEHFEFVPKLGGETAAFYIHTTGPAFSSFGFSLTGLGDVANAGTLHVEFHDKADEDIVVRGAPTGGELYFSYTGTSAPITDFRLVMTGVEGPNRDVFGIDDIRLATSMGTTAVPEPSVPLLTAVGLGLWLAGRALRRRSRRARA
jgi:hypothetical protein